MTVCRILSVVLVAGLFSMVGTGCSSVSASSLRANPSPSMITLADTYEDNENIKARTFDTNQRQIITDLNKIFLFDRPRRMSVLTVP